MNEQLQTALTQIIDRAISGIDASADFLSAELPDVISQLLLWYGIESLIYFILFLILSVIMPMACLRLSATVKKSRDDGEEWTKRCGNSSITSGSYDAISGLLRFSLVLSPIFLIIALNSLEWLQIMIAPKIWLLEYASNLVK